MSDLRETQDYLAEVIANRDRLRAALERIAAGVPGCDMSGCLYVAHFDAAGNETGVEYIDPAAFAQQVQEIARAALAGAGETKPIEPGYPDADGLPPPASAQHTDDEAHDRSADANWIAGATFGYIRGQMNEHQQYKDAVEARWKRIAESRAAFPPPAAPTKESAP